MNISEGMLAQTAGHLEYRRERGEFVVNRLDHKLYMILAVVVYPSDIDRCDDCVCQALDTEDDDLRLFGDYELDRVSLR